VSQHLDQKGDQEISGIFGRQYTHHLGKMVTQNQFGIEKLEKLIKKLRNIGKKIMI
tara:strand:+ start:348 stop:515 length:168 start_codon:yes stop_codon:yes gene_type:complete